MILSYLLYVYHTTALYMYSTCVVVSSTGEFDDGNLMCTRVHPQGIASSIIQNSDKRVMKKKILMEFVPHFSWYVLVSHRRDN
jgi:hypothetical protein